MELTLINCPSGGFLDSGLLKAGSLPLALLLPGFIPLDVLPPSNWFLCREFLGLFDRKVLRGQPAESEPCAR